jgi:hypothetical protein
MSPKKQSPKPKTKTKNLSGISDVTTRHIKPEVTAMLWGRAGGRCEFFGCNTPLWKSLVTQEKVNRAQRAHIYAFSESGPRGHKGISEKTLNNYENLMLLCHACHRKIDQNVDGGRYNADLLKEWKANHEQRIERVTGIDTAKQTAVILYGANVGNQGALVQFNDAANALFPRMYPNDDRGILLSTVNGGFTDKSLEFWAIESQRLRTHFDRKVRERLNDGELHHVSIFAIAPQPLLILLGSLLSDIAGAEVFQLHREPEKSWAWPKQSGKVDFILEEPKVKTSKPALVLALSSPVTDDRITNVIGTDCSIWKVTVPRPNMELIKCRTQLSAFRSFIRPVLDRIKSVHGETTPLSVFPVAGVSVAVELGRIRMPKASMPWEIYDQVNARGGFVPAITITD